MMHGLVLWYNAAKGYGVITPYDGSREILFHNVLALPDGTVPEPGKRLEYDENGEADLSGRSTATDVRKWSPQ